MTGRHWLRKDVILPIFYLAAFGALLYWLFDLADQIPAVIASDIIRISRIALIIIYVLLAVLTIRNAMSTYDLERYDPGDPVSLKRLMRRRRFRIGRQQLDEERLLLSIEQFLLDQGFRLENESHMIGRVYRRQHPAGLFNRGFSDRIFILQHEPLTVLVVDQLLQDAIRYIKTHEQPSRRNLLILVTRMSENQDAASAAAGIVNFLGKFKGGTLCPLLLATRQHRLFYPADRTLMPRLHRLYQSCQIWRLRRLIRENGQAAKDEPVRADMTDGNR